MQIVVDKNNNPIYPGDIIMDKYGHKWEVYDHNGHLHVNNIDGDVSMVLPLEYGGEFIITTHHEQQESE